MKQLLGSLALLIVVSCAHAETQVDLPQLDGDFWVALNATPGYGSSVVETSQGRVFLAFQADRLLQVVDGKIGNAWKYSGFQWHKLVQIDHTMESGLLTLHNVDRLRAVRCFKSSKDVYLPDYRVPGPKGLESRGRYGELNQKPRIYQMMLRMFGNENETKKQNGTLAENGTGKFSDLNAETLDRLKETGFTHIWITGVLQQATSTDYASVGQPADDPDLLKGIAGSPYAIKDYFDVCPDYADDPSKRLEEFRAMASRMRQSGLKLLIDFVPNHVARSYDSDIRPDLNFGQQDQKDVFYRPDNNFFYLTPEVTDGRGPLRLPTSETARLVGGADGLYRPETEHGRVTGNNAVSWQPNQGDWYETVKLNYGYNFLHPQETPDYPSAKRPDAPLPDTWRKMDAVIEYWQEMGVDGFRVDMAHMVPPEFWKWLIHRARQRNRDVFFMAEAYDTDPSKVIGHDPALSPEDGVMVALLDAGFDAVYDDPGYDTLEQVYSGPAWVNDLDNAELDLGPYFFDCAVRYAENHDEIRLAHPATWGGQGMEVGRAVAGALFGMSRGPVMVYHGQTVGETGEGHEGFGGDDQRTTIFDYWSLTELNKLLQGTGLSEEQLALHAWYARLLNLIENPAFSDGDFVSLNPLNKNNPAYGRVEDTTASGHWLYAYIRVAPEGGPRFLVTVNLHPQSVMKDVRLRVPAGALPEGKSWLVLQDWLLDPDSPPLCQKLDDAQQAGVWIDQLAPLSAYYWELGAAEQPPAGATKRER